MRKTATTLAVILAGLMLSSCNNNSEQTTATTVNKTTQIETKDAPILKDAPFSQGLRNGNLVFLAGQLGVVPETLELDNATFEAEVNRTFMNLQAVAKAGGGDLSDVVTLTVYLTDLNNFDTLNKVMKEYFKAPYPTRTTLEVSRLAKDAAIEVEGIMVLGAK
jgi:reactive intermediate/imine deaminase